MKKTLISIALALCLILALAACGAEGGTPESAAPETGTPETGTPESSAPETAGSELTAYEIEGVGTVNLPEGGEVYIDKQTEPFPNIQCGVNFGEATLHLGVMGPEAYEAAGVPLPESAEEFSTRSGPQADVPEGSVFAYDDFGNYFVQFTRDGQDYYYTLRVGEDTSYAITLLVPEGTMGEYSPGEWIAMIELA